MSLHMSFGDGTPISIGEMYKIRKTIHKHMVFNGWQAGDMLLIDNFSTSHDRQPTFNKGRKVVVAWSDPFTKTDTLNSIKGECVNQHDVARNEDIAHQGENPQERTPESSLTSEEAQKLKEVVVNTTRFVSSNESMKKNRCCVRIRKQKPRHRRRLKMQGPSRFCCMHLLTF